jgi:hypothetical protein
MDNITVQIKEFLERLGETSDQVAMNLKAYGIQGVRNTVRMLNPIVRFVEKNLSVRSLSIDLIRRDSICVTLPDGKKAEATISRAIRQFLDGFDQGRYAELEMGRAKGEQGGEGISPLASGDA